MYANSWLMVPNRSIYVKKYHLPLKYSYLQNKSENNKHVFKLFTQPGVKQRTDFLRTVTAASDLIDCTLVNCAVVE